jgi:SET domain-containing protein
LIADHNHLIKITNTLYLDTSHSISTFDVSNLTKFIHHSTKPNIRIQPFKDQLTSETQFFFVALKSIKQTDFISLNYGDHYKPPPNVLENTIFRI